MRVDICQGCRVVRVLCSVRAVASPVVLAGEGVRVGKGNGYNRVRAANAVPSRKCNLACDLEYWLHVAQTVFSR